MFSNLNKPAFGTSAATPSFGFGSTTTANQTPFGQPQLFGKTTTPGFGSSAPLFGSTSQQSTAPLFTNTAVPSFGATPQQSGFAATSLFGQQQNVTGGNGLFTGASTSTFGQQNKTAGFGFGASTTTPLFGQQQTQNFQPSTSAGVFGSSAGFGATTQMGTVIKFNPVTGTDTMQKSGITHSISTKHHCITCMKEYEAKSLEELRWEDYQCNRRGPQQQSSFGATPFGAPASTAPSLFGQTETKPAFGQSTSFGPAASGFGMANQQNQSTLFGKATTGFGATPTTNTFGFNATTPAFGSTAVKPFGAQPTQNVFGTPATTQPTGFGNNFFGQTSTQNTGGFFSKPAQTAFSTQQPVFTFGQQATNQTNFFQPPKSTAGFGSFGQTNLTTSTGFGQPSNIFSQAPQNPFNAFQKPAQPAFGQSLQPGGFGLGTQPGANTFFGANKPLFGTTTQSNFFTPPTAGFMMPQQQQPAQNPSAGFDTQQPQDFHTHVELIYEPFPHHDFLSDIAAKAKSHDATNPQALKEILDQAPMPVTAIEKNISKYRVITKPRSSFIGSKYALLDNVVDKPTTYNNYLLRNSTGKRLVLRRTVPRTEKEMVEEYKRMSSAGSNKNRSLFRNIHLLDETGTEKPDRLDFTDDGYPKPSSSSISPLRSLKSGSGPSFAPSPFHNKSPGPIYRSPDHRDKNSSIELKTEGTQTNGQTEKHISKNKSFPLVDLSDSDSDNKEEENLQLLPKSNEISSLAFESFNRLTGPDAGPKTSTVIEDDSMVQSPNSRRRNVKTVRFQDSEISSTSDEANVPSSSSSTKSMEDRDNNEVSKYKDGLGKQTGSDTILAESATKSISLSEKQSKSCGVKLERLEYYTIPPLDELYKYKSESGACVIKGFTIGRVGYGNIYFPDAMDISNMDLDEIIHFRYREITVYPDDDKKPPVGQGLNRRAQVTLDHVFPRDRITREVVKDVKEIAESNFTDRLCLLAEKQNANFLDYRPDTGSWVFTVEHFSKYQFSDADDAECYDLLEKTTREQELKQKELEKKNLEEQQEIQMEVVNRGLGGIIPPPVVDRSRDMSLSRPHPQARGMPSYKEDNKNVIIMKSSFFDEESISDDVSSSDVGIVQHFSIPTVPISGIATRLTADHGAKIRSPIKYFTLLNHRRETPLCRSLLVSHNYMDAAVFKGKSFKVGWSKGFTFTTITTTVRDPLVINEVHSTCGSDVVLHLNIGSLCGRREVMQLQEHLQIAYQESKVVIDNSGVPLFTVKDGTRSLIRHQTSCCNLDDIVEDTTVAHYREVWNLCLALWGPDATTPTVRLEMFSQWLEEAAIGHISDKLEISILTTKHLTKNLFLFLTAHQTRRAAKLAMDKSLPRLSALISQSQDFTRVLLFNQLEQWKQSGALSLIDRDFLKLYMLLGGVPVIDDLNVCEDLDWKRAVAIHLWYMCPRGTSLINAVNAYTQAFTSLCYAKEPTPEYCQNNPVEGVYDILYHIMLLFASPKTALNKILSTETHTKDALDYRLSWLLMQVFGALRLGFLSEQNKNCLHIKFATQLEHMGLWRWSVFVLLFIKDNSVKMNEVMAVLDRNLNPDRKSTDNLAVEDLLVNQFRIPPEWIHKVLAHKTEFLGKHVDSFKHLTLSKDWHKAHSIAISHLIPDLVASGQCERLSMLLINLIPGERHIASWNTRAGLILHFLKLQQRIALTKSNITQADVKELGKSNITGSDMIDIKSELISLCHRMKLFPTGSPKETLAVAEISRFIAVLLHLFYCELQPISQKNMNIAMAQINELVMPPDYKSVEIMKYVNPYVIKLT